MAPKPKQRSARAKTPADANEVYRLWQSLRDPEEATAEHRRREPRRIPPPGLSVSLRVGDKLMRASVLNVGQNGLGLFAKMEIPDRTTVQFRLSDKGEWLDGRVVHSTSTVGGYKIGLEPV